jgi:hypothetical protein
MMKPKMVDQFGLKFGQLRVNIPFRKVEVHKQPVASAKSPQMTGLLAVGGVDATF